MLFYRQILRCLIVGAKIEVLLNKTCILLEQRNKRLLNLNILDLIVRVVYIINNKVYYSIVVEIAFVILGVNWDAQLGYKHNSHINYVTLVRSGSELSN